MRSHVSAEVESDRPVPQVFKWLAEPDRDTRWQPGVAGHELTRRTNSVLGTEFVETLAKGGRSAQQRGRIVEFEPDALIGFARSATGLKIAAKVGVQSTATGRRPCRHRDRHIRSPAGSPAAGCRVADPPSTAPRTEGASSTVRTERSTDTKEASDA